MKNLIVACLVLLVTATFSFAAKESNVSQTVHNLTWSSPYTDTASILYQASDVTETQVCIFCHTPHGGSLDAPLWNRSMPSNSKYQHYSSATLSSTIDINRVVQAESLTCLSCHDGSIGVGDGLINNGGVRPSNWGATVVGIPRIGANRGLGLGASTDDLRDDHPISFSYTAAMNDANKPNQLNPDTEVEAAGLTLFGANQNVECSTCHDPHVTYDSNIDPAFDEDYRPFLAVPNTGSAMCLACHIK